MADVQPFRGLRYNQSIVKDLARVICPPYDIIPPALHEELHRRHEYNFIRLEDARSQPQDTNADNKYTRAAAVLQQWLNARVLLPEKQPAIYLHDHHFTFQGKILQRRGIIARIRLEEWEKGVVKPHENVIAVHVSDRINVLREMKVNTSPVLAMYQDKDKKIAALLTAQESLTPVMDVTMGDGERHVIRAVTDPTTLGRLSGYFKEPPIYVADGHHRYTSALTYRREMAKTPSASNDAPFNFVMMTLVDFVDPGMVIQGTHRVLRQLPEAVFAGIDAKLQHYFEIKRLRLDAPDFVETADRFINDEKFIRVSCLLKGENELMMLTLRKPESLAELMPDVHSDLVRQLDVSIVDHIILGKVLGLAAGFSDESKISYVHDRVEAAQMVMRQRYQLAMFVKPVKPELIKAISDVGEKMPRKSTYFYPKAPAGLVVNTLY